MTTTQNQMYSELQDEYSKLEDLSAKLADRNLALQKENLLLQQKLAKLEAKWTAAFLVPHDEEFGAFITRMTAAREADTIARYGTSL